MLLSGTPLQNHLDEVGPFHALAFPSHGLGESALFAQAVSGSDSAAALQFYTMVDFCNPGVLGTPAEFRKHFEAPILQGREPGSTADEAQLGLNRSDELSKIVNGFILRRTNSLLSAHLPPKVSISCHSSCHVLWQLAEACRAEADTKYALQLTGNGKTSVDVICKGPAHLRSWSADEEACSDV